MASTTPASTLLRVYAGHITTENAITDRCLRKWISAGKFPRPDGNLNGRNYWLADTYRQWIADVAAGKYRRAGRPFRGVRPDMEKPQ